jgi:hypothetical protein
MSKNLTMHLCHLIQFESESNVLLYLYKDSVVSLGLLRRGSSEATRHGDSQQSRHKNLREVRRKPHLSLFASAARKQY